MDSLSSLHLQQSAWGGGGVPLPNVWAAFTHCDPNTHCTNLENDAEVANLVLPHQRGKAAQEADHSLGSAGICGLRGLRVSEGTAFSLGLVSVLKSSTFHSQTARIN